MILTLKISSQKPDTATLSVVVVMRRRFFSRYILIPSSLYILGSQRVSTLNFKFYDRDWFRFWHSQCSFPLCLFYIKRKKLAAPHTHFKTQWQAIQRELWSDALNDCASTKSHKRAYIVVMAVCACISMRTFHFTQQHIILNLIASHAFRFVIKHQLVMILLTDRHVPIAQHCDFYLHIWCISYFHVNTDCKIQLQYFLFISLLHTWMCVCVKLKYFVIAAAAIGRSGFIIFLCILPANYLNKEIKSF